MSISASCWELDNEFQQESAVEHDGIIELALAQCESLTFEQQLELLDKLGIDYSAYVAEEVKTEVGQPKSLFDQLFT